jgi:SAM-dependent methyltransferase
MNNNRSKYFDIQSAKAAYVKGENVTQLLRKQKNIDFNTPEIIEVAYDLQAGTYIEHVQSHWGDTIAYATELAEILDFYVHPEKSVLDIGSGELTTLSLVINKLRMAPRHVFAFDISWSRVYKGLSFARKYMGNAYECIVPFVAEISEIPLRSKSISVTTSSHALEPNGGNLPALLTELFRVTVDKVILFEPCYEINSDQGKLRMDKLGFIKGIDAEVDKLGGRVDKKITIKNTKNISHPLNPTVCFVITPPVSPIVLPETCGTTSEIFSLPGTDIPLQKNNGFYYSKDSGLCFPILKSIPVLMSKSAVLASALEDSDNVIA